MYTYRDCSKLSDLYKLSTDNWLCFDHCVDPCGVTLSDTEGILQASSLMTRPVLRVKVSVNRVYNLLSPLSVSRSTQYQPVKWLGHLVTRGLRKISHWSDYGHAGLNPLRNCFLEKLAASRKQLLIK